ncbi:MAG: efflux RND transporter permease subunit [Gammaproteobacteria bacterium]|nr:MAG: efflux RND transporter permease subunit [Gammaproteobacteria bacterium]
MTLPEISIQRHVLALMASLVLVLFGVISFLRIGVDRYPEVDFPMISVTTTLPGANPEIVDSSITNLIETAVNSVPGIEHIQSQSFPGASVVRITFVLTKDIDVAFNEVQAKVNQVLADLPDDADPPVVAKVEFGALPVMWLVLQGDRTLQQLNQYARTVLKKRLENIEGVGEVTFGGRRERTIRINLDIDRMDAYGITTQDVLAALRREHFQLPGGFLVGPQREDLIKLDLEYHRTAELARLIVAWRDGAPIRIGDIATVEDGLADFRRIARFDGEPAVGLGIVKVTGANTVAIIREVQRRLKEEIVPQLPPGMKIRIATNDADLILELVHALEEHLLLGTLLTALVVWFFLKNLRATAIIAVAIPVSLLGAVMVMYFSGYTFNTMTLLALLLLIGVVVDDAIVVLENIYRHRETIDPDPRSAALAGTNQVVFAVLASSLTLVSIFAPVIFMEGVIGRFFRSFAVVVTFGVLVSLFVSVTLTPMLCSRHLEVVRRHGLLYRILEGGFRALERGYTALLRGVLRFRWTVLVLAVAAVWPSGFFLGQIGKGFLPQEDEGKFLVTFKAPLGSSLEYTDGRLRAIEAVLDRHPEIAGHFSTIGTGATGSVYKGTIFARLTPREQRGKHMYRVIDELRAELAGIPGVKAFPAPFSPIGGQRGEPLQFVLTGPSLEQVARLSQQLKQRLDAIPELGQVDLDLELELPQQVLRVDRTRAADVGLTTLEVAQAVNVLAGGLDVAKYNDLPGDGERYDVRVKATEGSLAVPADLSRIYLRGRQGTLVRLDTVARLEPGLGPAVVPRFDLRYSGNFYSTPTISLGEAVARVQAAAAGLLPPGYGVKMIGRAEEFGKTAKYMLFAFVTAIVLVYMVLASQFNAYLQPLVVMLAQPLAIVGGVAALWWAGMGLNIFSMIGLVLLMGLVAKNSILLIDLTNQLRNEGRGIREALLEACPIRLRPVLMTSATIIVTMLPAALGFGAGADTNGPLAVAVIGGMVSSTLLTLVVVPAAYSLLEGGLARLRRRRAGLVREGLEEV